MTVADTHAGRGNHSCPPPHSDNHAFASVNLLFALPYKKPALQLAGAQVLPRDFVPAGTCVYPINLLRFASVWSRPVPWHRGGLLLRESPLRGSFTICIFMFVISHQNRLVSTHWHNKAFWFYILNYQNIPKMMRTS